MCVYKDNMLVKELYFTHKHICLFIHEDIQIFEKQNRT